MISPDKGLLDQAKGMLKRVPVVQRLLSLKGSSAYKMRRIRELSGLIKENRIVVFPLYSSMGNDAAIIREMVHKEVKEWLDFYGIIHLRRATAADKDSPAGNILLYAPLALLRIPPTHEEYLSQVRRKTRYMIRKAEGQGYEFKEFVWNDHLDEIFEINTSKEIRQSIPMRD